MAHTILVVDDEPRIVQIARDYLVRAGFDVISAGDGALALQLMRRNLPALVVLDVMLPHVDGLDVLRTMRRDALLARVPVIMLTARVEEQDKLFGLGLGADDYLTKPFSPRELVARVRTVLRRVDGGVDASIVRFADLEIDLGRRAVRVAGNPVELTATEFELLRVLARSPGRPFTREQLLDLVYDDAFAGFDRTIDAHIKNLRRKIEADPRSPRYILTLYGVGYKFAEA